MKSQNTKIKILHSGFSLVEMLIYVFLMTILVVAVVNSIVRMSKTYRDIRATKTITISAETLLNRFSYEVKQASNLSGTFGTTSSSLILTTSATTTIFSLDNNTKRVLISVNGVIDYLTSTEVQTTKLNFLQLQATSTSKGVIMQFTLTNNSGTSPHAVNFESSSMIRNLSI